MSNTSRRTPRVTARQRSDMREAMRLADELGRRLTFPIQDWNSGVAALSGDPDMEITVHGETHRLSELCPAARAAIERHWFPITSKLNLARLIYSQMFQYLPHLVAPPPDGTPGRAPDYWRHRP